MKLHPARRVVGQHTARDGGLARTHRNVGGTTRRDELLTRRSHCEVHVGGVTEASIERPGRVGRALRKRAIHPGQPSSDGPLPPASQLPAPTLGVTHTAGGSSECDDGAEAEGERPRQSGSHEHPLCVDETLDEELEAHPEERMSNIEFLTLATDASITTLHEHKGKDPTSAGEGGELEASGSATADVHVHVEVAAPLMKPVEAFTPACSTATPADEATTLFGRLSGSFASNIAGARDEDEGAPSLEF
jgi:hypothetical protein